MHVSDSERYTSIGEIFEFTYLSTVDMRCTESTEDYTVEPLYNEHLWGTKFWPLYRGGLCRGVVLCTNSSFGTCAPGRYITVGLSSGVAVKRGSTVTICD